MPRPTTNLAQGIATADSPARKLLVLVADPDEDTRALYREIFEQNGCEIIEALDGRDALTKALVRPPTLVVTEVVLPFIDGYSLCEILRRDQATMHARILVVTGETRAGELSRARRSGANAVLVKPTAPDTIWTETQRVLADVADPGCSVVERNRGDLEAGEPSAPHSALSKAFSRFTTTTPPKLPPALVCPSCDQPLVYQHSHVGGVSERHREQWDGYMCPGGCGGFQYRQRTRKVRRVE